MLMFWLSQALEKMQKKVEALGSGSKSLNGCLAEKWSSENGLCLLTEN